VATEKRQESTFSYFSSFFLSCAFRSFGLIGEMRHVELRPGPATAAGRLLENALYARRPDVSAKFRLSAALQEG
jgi:hypothetical protein